MLEDGPDVKQPIGRSPSLRPMTTMPTSSANCFARVDPSNSIRDTRIGLPCAGDQQAVEKRSKSKPPAQPFAQAGEPEHNKRAHEILSGERKALADLAGEGWNIPPKIANGDDENDTQHSELCKTDRKSDQ